MNRFSLADALTAVMNFRGFSASASKTIFSMKISDTLKSYFKEKLTYHEINKRLKSLKD